MQDNVQSCDDESLESPKDLSSMSLSDPLQIRGQIKTHLNALKFQKLNAVKGKTIGILSIPSNNSYCVILEDIYSYL